MGSSLLTGVSGLRVHQQMLDVVGHNLANSNTPGFKSQRIRFADLFYQTLRPATAGNDSIGGGNASQIGLGVRTAAIDSNLGQGNLRPTGNVLDLAIQGQGHFVLEGGGKTVYTRAGAFGVDQENFVTDLATGLRVQRFGALGDPVGNDPGFQVQGDNRIRVPIGARIPPTATDTITLEGNLSADATGPRAHTLTTSAPFLTSGAPATLGTSLNDLDNNLVDYVGGDQLRLQGSDAGGTPVDVAIAVPATLGDLITAINGNFPGATASLDATGNLVLQSNTTGLSTLNLTISDEAGSTGQTTWGNHVLSVTTLGKDGDTAPTTIQFFDTQGRTHSLNLVFQKQTDNSWDLTGSIPSDSGTTVDNLVQGITFNQDGSFSQANGTGAGDPFMTFQLNGLPTPQTIRMELGTPNSTTGLTHFGGQSSAAAIRQNGNEAGSLQEISVGTDGVFSGTFTNGQTLPLAQLAIAQFANAGGLTRQGENHLTQSAQSGEALLGGAGSGGRGTIQQGSLEESNVDVALEFTQLIIAQRGFQVNARTITVSDEVLQELANLIR